MTRRPCSLDYAAALTLALAAACGRIDYDPLIDGGDAVDGAPDGNDGPPACTTPYVPVDGSCYRVETAAATWTAAEAQCESEGAHLVIVDSVAEHFVVHALLEAATVPGGWIGASDRITEGTFRWVGAGGFDLLSDTCFFGPSGPPVDPTLNCVASQATTTCGDYFTFACTDTHPFVCERDGVAVLPGNF